MNTFALLIAVLLASTPTTAPASQPTTRPVLTVAPFGAVVPIGGSRVEVTSATTRRVYTVEEDGRLTP